MNDICRLVKLNDFEGLKIRVMQIYREKEDEEKLINDQQEYLVQLKELNNQKDQLLEE